jgi:outer membrane immunogenic protein
VRRIALSYSAFALSLALAASSARADGLYPVFTGPNGADFSGFEVGPDVGLGLGTASSASVSGPVGGAHLGYNLQTGRIVGGVEGDVMFSGMSSGSFGSASFGQDVLGSARVKGGYSFGDIMAYGTIGWAWSNTSFQDLGVTSSETVKGLAFGLGAEYAITRNFSVRAEYLRYDFGNANYVTPASAQTINTSTNLLRIGGSVHF